MTEGDREVLVAFLLWLLVIVEAAVAAGLCFGWP